MSPTTRTRANYATRTIDVYADSEPEAWRAAVVIAEDYGISLLDQISIDRLDEQDQHGRHIYLVCATAEAMR